MGILSKCLNSKFFRFHKEENGKKIAQIDPIYRAIKNPPPKVSDNSNRQLIIMGNGPSLKDSIPELLELKKESTNDFFSVNEFPIDKIFFELKPKYHCITDLVRPELFSLPDIIEMFKMLNKANWEMIFYTHVLVSEKRIKEFLVNPLINKVFFDGLVVREYNNDDKEEIFESYKNLTNWVHAKNIMNNAIFIGINLNYPKILLYGVDHDFFNGLYVDKNNILYYRYSQFFKNQDSVPLKPIIGGWKEPVTYRVGTFLKSRAGCFICHDILEEYAKYMRVKIINCTKNSLIDSYERK